MTATALSEFDTLVAEMVAMKIPREKAEAAARKELGIIPKSQLQQIRDDAEVAESEAEVERVADQIMGALGFAIIRLSQRRASKVTAGVPDRYYVHPRRLLAVWVELKSATGRPRPEQLQFAQLCRDADLAHVLGGIDALRAWLVENRVATFDASGLPQPIPVSDELERYWRQKQTYAAVMDVWRADGGLGPEPPRPIPPSARSSHDGA